MTSRQGFLFTCGFLSMSEYHWLLLFAESDVVGKGSEEATAGTFFQPRCGRQGCMPLTCPFQRGPLHIGLHVMGLPRIAGCSSTDIVTLMWAQRGASSFAMPRAEAGAAAAQEEYRDEPGSVIAADFYHSNALMAMDDADIVAKVHRNLITCEPGFSGAKVTAALQVYTLYLSFLPERAQQPLSVIWIASQVNVFAGILAP